MSDRIVLMVNGVIVYESERTETPPPPPPPPPPTETPQGGTYIREVHGHPPIDGRFIVGFAHPADPHIFFDIQVDAGETKRWQLGGAEAWAQGDIQVKVNGQLVDPSQQEIGPGFYHLEISCVDNPNTRLRGAGRTAIEFYRIA